jgi:hypothetical protein
VTCRRETRPASLLVLPGNRDWLRVAAVPAIPVPSWEREYRRPQHLAISQRGGDCGGTDVSTPMTGCESFVNWFHGGTPEQRTCDHEYPTISAVCLLFCNNGAARQCDPLAGASAVRQYRAVVKLVRHDVVVCSAGRLSWYCGRKSLGSAPM